MRTVARQPPQDDAALDYARDVGYYQRQTELLEQQLEQARRRPWTQHPALAVACFIIFVIVGIRFAPSFYAWWYGWEDTPVTTAPLATAAVPTRTALPTAPYAPPAALGGGEAPTPAYEGAIRTYNEQQEQRATALAAQEAEPTASEEEIKAWLEGPPSTPTPLPEPGEAGFKDSFADPGCSPFIGYLPGDPCIEILKQQGGE